jgi:hypothetical protein
MRLFPGVKSTIVSTCHHIDEPATFLSVAYGTSIQVGRILAIRDAHGRTWAQTSSGIPFIFPIGGPDYAALLDHSGL